MAGDKVKLASADWYRRVETEAQQLVSALPKDESRRFSFVELYRDAPADVSLYGTHDPGYRLDFEGSAVRLRPGVDPNDRSADLFIAVDFDAVRALSAIPTGPDLSKLSAKYASEGKFEVHGDRAAMPIDLSRLHDAMTACTFAS